MRHATIPVIAWLAALIFVAFVFSPLATLPFVLDDWHWINLLHFSPPGHIVERVLSPQGRIFYRPLSALYYLAVYHVCGAEPAIFRAGAFLGISLMSLASGWVVWVWTRQRFTAVAVAGLFIASVPVHMELAMWIVGMNDIGAAACGFLAIGLLLSRRDGLGACAAALGLLFKESAIFVPLLGFLHVMLWPEQGRLRRDAAGVGHQVVDGDAGGPRLVGRAREGERRQPARDRVVHGQHPGLLQLHDGEGRERLGDGPEAEAGVRRDGQLAVYVATAEAVLVDGGAVACERNRRARDAAFLDERLCELLKSPRPAVVTHATRLHTEGF